MQAELIDEEILRTAVSKGPRSAAGRPAPATAPDGGEQRHEPPAPTRREALTRERRLDCAAVILHGQRASFNKLKVLFVFPNTEKINMPGKSAGESSMPTSTSTGGESSIPKM